MGEGFKFERQKLEAVFEMASAAIAFWRGPDFIFEKINPTYQSLFSDRPLVGQKFLETCPEFADQKFVQIFRDVLETGKAYKGEEFLARMAPPHGGAAENRYFDFECVRIVDDEGRPYGILNFTSDVTDRVKARKQLEAAHAALQNDRQNWEGLFSQAAGFLTVLGGRDMRYEVSNPMHDEIVGPNVIGKTVLEVVPDSKAAGVLPLLQKVYDTGRAEIFHELPMTVGNELRYFDASYVARKNSSGEIDGIMAIGLDVTELVGKKKYVEKILAEMTTEREKLESIIKTSATGIALCRGRDFVFEKVNDRFIELVGPREYIGKTWRDVYSEIPESPLPDIMLEVYQTGERFVASESKVRVDVGGGKIEDRFYDFAYERITESAGNPYGVLIQCNNVTERVVQRIQLQESVRDVVDTLESMSDGFFSVDKNWTITHVNRAMEQATGRTRDQLIGQNHLQLFFSGAAEQNSINWREYHKSMRDRVPATYEDYYAPLDIWSQVRLFPKPDGGLAIFFKDVTESRRAENLLKVTEVSFKAITEATPLIVWTATPEGNVDYANSKWYEFSGLSEEQTLGYGFTSIIHPDDVQQTLAKFGESLTLIKPLEIEHRFKRASDETYRWFLTRALPSLDAQGHATKWFGTNVDIHDQKLAAAELVIARDEAERANQTKSSFLANMSHEIRTPLGAIIGFADLLKERDLASHERQQYLDTISRNGKALTRIIDDILDLAKVESGKLEFERVEFSFFDLIDDVMDLFRERTRSKEIYLRAHIAKDIPSKLISDPTRLRQILINIVGNAVKFTEHGGVSIEVTATALSGFRTGLKIAVKDTGIGIADAQMKRLFEPFTQADNSTTRKFGGTGLGLSLSRRLAKALGGDITIEEDRLNSGSTFVISFLADLPSLHTSPAAHTPPLKVPTDGKPLAGIRVLVADDSKDNLFLVNRLLTKFGATVELANDGAEAFRMGLEGRYDLVLMDIQMPKMDGYEATKALREAGFKNPIVALTAHAMAEERARSLAAGCSAHLTKPLNQTELVETIRKLAL